MSPTLLRATLFPFCKKIQEIFSSNYLGPKEIPVILMAAGEL